MRSRFAFVVGMTFLALPGCLYHSGYNPYGYYGPGPSVLPSQPWNGYPNVPMNQPGSPYQPVVPMTQPGTFPTPIGGDPYVPGGSPGTNPTYQTPAGGTAPTFSPTPGNSGGTGVPNPDDDGNNFNRSNTQRPTITPTSGAKVIHDDDAPFEDQKSTKRPSNFDESPVADSDSPFETPVVQVSNTSSTSQYDDPEEKPEPVQVSNKKYAYDPKFAWVQGVVEFDDPTNTWVIMYNDNPRTSDVYGGVLTLGDDPELSQLRTGKMYRISGTLDRSEKDSRGRPIYRATSIEPRKQ